MTTVIDLCLSTPTLNLFPANLRQISFVDLTQIQKTHFRSKAS